MNNKVYSELGESVFSEKLENGLEVIVVKKPGYTKKYAYFATNYGGVDRRFKLDNDWIDTPMGVAHFLEHKMFDMPEGNALNTLSQLGASPNAYTAPDITAYHFECADNFNENLRVLLSFVSTPYFTKESVEKEQGIIGQEIGMDLDYPGSEMYYGLLKCLYENNPARDTIVGTVDSISEITPETLYDCHKVFYNPSNMVLCVVGDVDENEVVATAKEVVTQQAGTVPERDYGIENSPLPYKRRAEKNMQVASPIFLAGSKVDMPEGGDEYLKKILIGQMAVRLFLGESSPLYARLYSQGLIMSGFSAGFEPVADTAFTAVGGESRDVDAAFEEICRGADEIAENGFPDDYFERVKKSAIGDELRGLNSFDDICYNAAKGYFKNFDPFMSVETLRSITSEDARRFISEYMTKDRLAISIINPLDKKEQVS